MFLVDNDLCMRLVGNVVEYIKTLDHKIIEFHESFHVNRQTRLMFVC